MVTLLERPAIQAVETAVPAKVCGGLPYWQEQIAQILGSYTPDNLQFFEVVFGLDAELQASIGNDPEHNKTWQPASGYIGEAISGFEYARIMGDAA